MMPHLALAVVSAYMTLPFLQHLVNPQTSFKAHLKATSSQTLSQTTLDMQLLVAMPDPHLKTGTISSSFH